MSQQSNKDGWLKLRLEDDILKELAELARTNERTTAGEARLAIRRHLELERVEPRSQVKA